MEPMTDMSSQYASQEWWGDGNPRISHSNSHLTKVLEVKEAIIIDKYECELENGQVVYYAVKGKTKYRMPEAYKAMYDDQHLAIRERYMVRPELFDTTEKHYIPLRTDYDA